MSTYLFFSLILATLGTLLINPALYCFLFKCRKAYTKRGIISVTFSQIGLFVLGYILSVSVMLTFHLPACFSTVLAYLWLPAILQCINAFLLYDSNKYFRKKCFKFCNIPRFSLIIAFIFLAISAFIGIHKNIYEYFHQNNSITYMDDDISQIPNISDTILPEYANIIEGSKLGKLVYRNGHWIYPIVSNSSNASSSGYLVLSSDNQFIHFEAHDIIYSPWTESKTNVYLIARDLLPSKVLFGDASFQIKPDSNDVCFAIFYGDYACIRAGRQVEGVIIINASTGEHELYPASQIPTWITGISF